MSPVNTLAHREKRGGKTTPPHLNSMRYVKASKHFDSGSMMPIRIEPHCDIDSQIMLIKVSAEVKINVSIATF